MWPENPMKEDALIMSDQAVHSLMAFFKGWAQLSNEREHRLLLECHSQDHSEPKVKGRKWVLFAKLSLIWSLLWWTSPASTWLWLWSTHGYQVACNSVSGSSDSLPFQCWGLSVRATHCDRGCLTFPTAYCRSQSNGVCRTTLFSKTNESVSESWRRCSWLPSVFAD